MVALESSEHSHLENVLLLDEVTMLLAAVEACVSKANTAPVNTQLLREGFRKTHSLYKAAHRDLKVLKCKNELPFPFVTDEEPGYYEGLRDLIGGVENALGITDTLLIQSAGSCLNSESMGGYTDLLQEIELRLEDRRHWLSEILECPGSLVDESALIVDTLEASQQAHLATLLGLAEDIKYYMELLSSFLEQQTKFVASCKLSSQKDLDIKQNNCLVSACRTQMLKIQVIEQRLLAITYTGQTIPALRAVSKHVQDAEAKADTELQQVAAQVEQYESLGPEFEDLACRHHKLLEELRHAEYTLQEFQQEASATVESP